MVFPTLFVTKLQLGPFSIQMIHIAFSSLILDFCGSDMHYTCFKSSLTNLYPQNMWKLFMTILCFMDLVLMLHIDVSDTWFSYFSILNYANCLSTFNYPLSIEDRWFFGIGFISKYNTSNSSTYTTNHQLNKRLIH